MLSNVLIIQTDGAYFLYETIQVLLANSADLENYHIKILVDPNSLAELGAVEIPSFISFETNLSSLDTTLFNMSFNLSLNEISWSSHEKVNSENKAGFFLEKDQLKVNGIWSTWFLTLKSNSPFITFHLREIYRNILGLKKKSTQFSKSEFTTIVLGNISQNLFSWDEQEALSSALVRRFPEVKIIDESEWNDHQQTSSTLYLGPSSLFAIKLMDQGARGIFLTSRFQGTNLIPEHDGNLIISSCNQTFKASSVISIIEDFCDESSYRDVPEVCLYRVSLENVFGVYIESLFGKEENYPLYQAHVVLWNYLLSLFDVNLDVQKPSEGQIAIISHQINILEKVIQIHNHAMSSLQDLFHEVKQPSSSDELVQYHQRTLQDVEATLDKVASSSIFLRPILDYYRVRKGQSTGENLREVCQNSILTYSEEGQALKGYEELLSYIKNR